MRENIDRSKLNKQDAFGLNFLLFIKVYNLFYSIVYLAFMKEKIKIIFPISPIITYIYHEIILNP